MKILAEKLTSRKLWISVVCLICGIVLCANGDASEGGTLIAVAVGGYTIPECAVDVARLLGNQAAAEDKEVED